MPYCPKCGKQTSDAFNFCGACGFNLKEEEPQAERASEAKEITAQQAKQAEPIGASLPMKCVNHPERDTIGICSNCGKGICTYCRTVIEGRGYCPSCVEKLVKEESKSTSGITPTKSALAPMGWNWGAFFLTWLWGIFNGVWISLLALVPIIWIVMPFVLGASGSQWAWEKQQWKNAEHFKRVQKQWAWAGLIVFLLIILLNLAILLCT